MGETVMGLLYAIFSIFITLIFPKQITDVICYGRHRDRENIKSKKIYCLIYVFWTLFFGLFCLIIMLVIYGCRLKIIIFAKIQSIIIRNSIKCIIYICEKGR